MRTIQKSEYDFSEMPFDPTVNGKMTEVYPEISVYPDFKVPDSVQYDTLDELVRYCFLWLDGDSPFYRVRDLKEKQKNCIQYAGCGPEAINEIEKEGRDFRKVLLQALKLTNNYLFDEWWSRKLAYHSDISYLSASFDVGNEEKQVAAKMKIKEKISGDRETLLQLENSLFNDKRTMKAVTQAANEASLEGYAEKHATNFFEEPEIENNPYIK
jgi:hypothetical protein